METPTLAYLDEAKPVVPMTHASGVILQDGEPIAFPSHTLNRAERNCAIIGKECLAILVSCTKFHQYIYGKPDVSIQTDHHPLESIFSKPVAACPELLRRMRLALQRRSITVVYIRGETNFIADALSRNPHRWKRKTKPKPSGESNWPESNKEETLRSPTSRWIAEQQLQELTESYRQC